MFKPEVHTAFLVLLVTAFALPWQETGVIVAVGCLAIGGVLANPKLRTAAGIAVRRMRWLLLSLLVLALFFTPGEPVFESLASVSPSWDGVELMLERGLLLLTLAMLATAFISSYQPAEIVAAIQKSIRFLPHRYANRLAVRIYLVLEEFPAVEERVRAARASKSDEVDDQGFVRAAVAIIRDIETGVFTQAGINASGSHTAHSLMDDLRADQRPRTFVDKVSGFVIPILLLGVFIVLAASLSSRSTCRRSSWIDSVSS